MTVEVRRDDAQSQYTILKDGRTVGFAAFQESDSEIAFTHTEVDPAEQGNGYAAVLVQHALDDVKATSDKRVVPACSYVAKYVEKNPQYEELVRR
ncbi:hypothetical protein EDF46_1469 [Frondihabitans sp. PhB188]|uniref:GNAT family N-acetyltransferase n=1 Tax=Frondihabitans sp. PhB188 TaxID=2485200 RepID=UPI000F49F5DC|nr:GNAT family N-acetyltransferase [Frondihabitans sp. PhB188]ROQ39834.1 hypothetical protein EDF46_1469 [Frondihabitans sp. PhB188]